MSNASSTDKNKIVFNGKEMELKTLSGTVGPSVVDIRSLYSDLAFLPMIQDMDQLVHVSQALPI